MSSGVRGTVQCGTYSGYRTHLKKGEQVCPACRAAATRYVAEHPGGGSTHRWNRNTDFLAAGIERIAREHGVTVRWTKDFPLMILWGSAHVAVASIRKNYWDPLTEEAAEKAAWLNGQGIHVEHWCPDSVATGEVRRVIRKLSEPVADGEGTALLERALVRGVGGVAADHVEARPAVALHGGLVGQAG